MPTLTCHISVRRSHHDRGTVLLRFFRKHRTLHLQLRRTDSDRGGLNVTLSHYGNCVLGRRHSLDRVRMSVVLVRLVIPKNLLICPNENQQDRTNQSRKLLLDVSADFYFGKTYKYSTVTNFDTNT